MSHLSADKVGTAQSGKDLLNVVMGKPMGFGTVKPPALIEEFIWHFDKNSIILDPCCAKHKMAGDMLRFIYEPIDEIHDIGYGMYFTADNDNEAYKEVFGIIFKAMGQEQHYKKMSDE